VEDPIEFIHRHQSCIVNQREIGTDTNSFAAALKYALRQDPDVVLVAKCATRDHRRRLDHCETGHLAFATLHTNSAMESINASSTCSVAQQARCGPSSRSCSRASSPRPAAESQGAGPRDGVRDPHHDARGAGPDSDEKIEQIPSMMQAARSTACRR